MENGISLLEGILDGLIKKLDDCWVGLESFYILGILGVINFNFVGVEVMVVVEQVLVMERVDEGSKSDMFY